MNYAEDRLDRKARGMGLWDDFTRAIRSNQHDMLGRTLRDVGWIRHAVFHFSRQCSNDNNNNMVDSVGDYAQMAEFAGYPEIGILALLHYRNQGRFENDDHEAEEMTNSNFSMDDPSWLKQEAPNGHCGCGSDSCGRSLCHVNMVDLEPILEAIETYLKHLPTRTMPTAHQVLAALEKKQQLECISNDQVPELLQFWRTGDDSSNYKALSPVLQLLLLKQLYLVMPTLAAEAVVHLKVNQRVMAADFKSHNAYHVLIRSVVLGERIKPSRRKTMPLYHVPVWDVLWGHDDRHQSDNRPSISSSLLFNSWQHPTVDKIIDHFRACLGSCQTKQEHQHQRLSSPPPLLMTMTPHKPLFVVGDSHVLSSAWQTIRLSNGTYRTMYPVIVTGLKAWHCRQETRFFTQSLLQVLLQRLSLETDSSCTTNGSGTSCCTTILLSAGEIDCREGLGGPQLEGYHEAVISSSSMNDYHVHNTVQEFVRAVSILTMSTISQTSFRSLTIGILPVCPHIHRSHRNGKATGRAVRRQVTRLWNEQLRQCLTGRNESSTLSSTSNSSTSMTGPAACGDIISGSTESTTLSTSSTTSCTAAVGRDGGDDDDGNHSLCKFSTTPMINNHVQFLDYEQELLDDGYTLKKSLNADGTHMNSAFLPFLEKALTPMMIANDFE